MTLDPNTLHQIINTFPDPVFVKDRKHRWVFLNDACCRFIGHPREELLGKSDRDFFPKGESDFTDAKGVTHTILTRETLYTDAQGVPFIVGIIRDITDRKKAEQTVVELARSEAEWEQLELFAYVASHDMREPLQSIIGFSDLLKNRYHSVLDEQGQNYLKRVQEAAARMSRLIDDLLKFSKVVKRSELFSMVDLGKIVRDIVADFEFQLQKTGGEIRVGPLPVLYGDETQIRQLFQNLISNALKFHLPDKAPRVLVQSRELDGGRVEISVEDNGIGIEEKFFNRIFKPFERLHGRAEFEGSGIGLAICEKIVAHHEGEIFVKSQPKEGSTFKVVLHKFSPRL